MIRIGLDEHILTKNKMKRVVISCLLVFSIIYGNSQANVKPNIKGQFSIYYSNFERGQLDKESNPIILTIEGARSRIIESFGEKKLISQVPKEIGYVFVDSAKCFQTAILSNGETIMYNTPFEKLPKLELTEKVGTVLGYSCKIYKTVVRSNQIEVWVSEAFDNIKATPTPSVGIPNGVALKIVINGNSEIVATKFVNNIASKKIDLPTPAYKMVTSPIYRSMISNSYVTTVGIFDNEQICFGCIDTTKIESDNLLKSVVKFANGTLILRKVLLPKMAKCAIFAELTECSNGDAYDRTGSVFVIPTTKKLSFLDGCNAGVKILPAFIDNQGKSYQGVVATDDYAPIIELIRFYTPFGLKQYNTQVTVDGLKWSDSAFYKQEITALLPILQDEVWIGVFIGNYDKGGHKISLKLKYYPDSKEIGRAHV